MDFLISPAWAQQEAGGPGFEILFMLGAFFLIMYFLIIRPQNKRNKEHKQMLSELSEGDEVVTSGGMLGRVTEIGDNSIALEVQRDVVVQVQKQAITTVMPKGTLKTG